MLCSVNCTKRFLSDGRCDGGPYDTEECGWDGGDCTHFRLQFPQCEISAPYLIGNNQCQLGQYNTAECGWDGGDCQR